MKFKRILDKNRTDIVIISYNTCELTVNCINSIYETAGALLGKIILVDNASDDDSSTVIAATFPEVNIIQNQRNLGYAGAVNIGVSQSDKEFVIISNPDVIYKEYTITKLIELLIDDPQAGAAGPQQYYPDGKPQYSYGEVPGIKLGLKKLFFIEQISDFFKNKLEAKKIKQVGYIDGAVMAVRRSAFDDVSGFDEDYFFFTEEADFCFKLKQKNWKIIHHPEPKIIHFRGATSYDRGLNQERLKMMIESKGLFCKKHLSFQGTKFYMILEIISSMNMYVLWFFIGFFCSGELRKTAKDKARIYELFFNLWVDEFNNLMSK